MSRSVEERARQRADDVFAALEDPVRSAAEFYALYYLVEIEGVDELAFDLQETVDAQWSGFYWYGIYSIANEMSNVDDKFLIDGIEVGDLAENEEFGRIREFVSGLTRPHPETGEPVPLEGTAEEFLVDVFENIERWFTFHHMGGDVNALTNWFAFLQRQHDVLDDPDRFIRLIQASWEAMPHPERREAEPWEIQATWRSSNYQGPAWVGVCEHLRRRDDLSKTAWVDQSWAIEHNNRNWIDKIEFDVGITDQQFLEAGLAMGGYGHTVEEVKQTLPATLAVLQDLLDAAHNDVQTVLDVAEVYDPDNDFSISRWRRRLNV